MPYKGDLNLPLTRAEATRCNWEDVRNAYWSLASDEERDDYRQKAGGKAVTISTPHYPSSEMWICLQAPGQGFGCWWDPQQKGLLGTDNIKLKTTLDSPSNSIGSQYHAISVDGNNISIDARIDASDIDKFIRLLTLYKDHLGK